MEMSDKAKKEALIQALRETFPKFTQRRQQYVPRPTAAKIINECMTKCQIPCSLEKATGFLDKFNHDQPGVNTRLEIRKSLMATAGIIMLSSSIASRIQQKNAEKRLCQNCTKPLPDKASPVKRFRVLFQQLKAENKPKYVRWVPFSRASELISGVARQMGRDTERGQIMEVLTRLDEPKKEAVTWKEMRSVCEFICGIREIDYKRALEERRTLTKRKDRGSGTSGKSQE